MIKLETHSHSLGASRCARETAETIANIYKQAGYGGIVLTNHLCHNYFIEYEGDTNTAKKEYFIRLYDDFANQCEKAGLKHFFGAEVTALDKDGYISEYLLYGLTPKLIMDSPLLFTLTQRELFEFSKENGLFMCQSHPFRNYIRNGYWEHLHAVEVFNGHQWHTNNNDLAEKFADTYGLIKLSGTDFHASTQTPNAGIYIPEDINTDRELVEFLFKGNFELIKG